MDRRRRVVVMALIAYKDLCIDAVDAPRLARFWGAALGLDVGLQDNGDAYLTGPTPQHTIWINQVPEAKSVKNRLHIDVRASTAEEIEALGARVIDRGSFPWIVMADPEGGELCVFSSPGPTGLKSIVIDCTDHRSIAQWWADVLGATCATDPSGYSSVSDIPGAPSADLDLDFVPVPEPKSIKNRLHLDVTTADLDGLIAAGAALLRPIEPPIRWNVMADPEGNEFCAFVRPGLATAS